MSGESPISGRVPPGTPLAASRGTGPSVGAKPQAAHPDGAFAALPVALSRRHFLWQSGGLGAIALAWLLARDGRAAEQASPWASSPTRSPHFAPRAKRVVQIFCAGGVSHVDTFDHKPDLAKYDGKPLEGKGENSGFFGQ